MQECLGRKESWTLFLGLHGMNWSSPEVSFSKLIMSTYYVGGIEQDK